MHSFFKLSKQVKEGDILLGSTTIHDQPKQHRFSEVKATVVTKDKNSIKLECSYNKDYPELPAQILLRKANIMEYGSDFRVIYDEENVLILFVIPKFYF